MDEICIDINDIERLQKRGIRLAEAQGAGAVKAPEKPLAGIIRKQRNRNRSVSDVLNIGAGTRCQHCGMLYFMWVDKCSTCSKAMEYNMGTRDEKVRL